MGEWVGGINPSGGGKGNMLGPPGSIVIPGSFSFPDQPRWTEKSAPYQANSGQEAEIENLTQLQDQDIKGEKSWQRGYVGARGQTPPPPPPPPAKNE